MLANFTTKGCREAKRDNEERHSGVCDHVSCGIFTADGIQSRTIERKLPLGNCKTKLPFSFCYFDPMCMFFLCFVGGGYVGGGVSDTTLVMLVAVVSVTVVLLSAAVAVYFFVRFCFPGGRCFREMASCCVPGSMGTGDASVKRADEMPVLAPLTQSLRRAGM